MLQSILTSFPALPLIARFIVQRKLCCPLVDLVLCTYLPHGLIGGPRISLFCCSTFIFIFVISVFHCVVFVCCCFCSRHYHDDADSRRLRWPTPEIDPRVTSRFVPHLCLLFVLQEKSHAGYFHFRLGHISSFLSFQSFRAFIPIKQTDLRLLCDPVGLSVETHANEWRKKFSFQIRWSIFNSSSLIECSWCVWWGSIVECRLDCRKTQWHLAIGTLLNVSGPSRAFFYLLFLMSMKMRLIFCSLFFLNYWRHQVERSKSSFVLAEMGKELCEIEKHGTENKKKKTEKRWTRYERQQSGSKFKPPPLGRRCKIRDGFVFFFLLPPTRSCF